jgi:hypothetical protein
VLAFSLLAGAAAASPASRPVTVPPGADLQAALDRGEDLWLDPRGDYAVTATLHYRQPGQRIATRGAAAPEDYAMLRLAPGTVMTLLNATGVAEAALERVTLAGERATLRPPGGKVEARPFTAWGGPGGDHQTIRQCVFVEARCGGGWAAIHVNEGARGVVVVDNLIFGAGVDPQGNGRAETELPFGWGDGISTASRDTLVRNNLIVDATDDGIMVQGAPGTTVEDNVILAYSRALLGGIALIDPFADYELAPGSKRFDYRGVQVRRNHIEAAGSRIHLGIALGGPGWHQRFAGTTLVGATVEANTLAGEAFGYGVVANGIDGFVVRGNVSTATHSGRGDGPRREPPEPAAAFLYAPGQTGDSALQPEFVAARAPLTNLLAAWPPPADDRGYRRPAYTAPEARGIVRLAYHEMLGREPAEAEWAEAAERLRAEGMTADALRALLRPGAGPGAEIGGDRAARRTARLLAAWRAAHAAEPAAAWPAALAIRRALDIRPTPPGS